MGNRLEEIANEIVNTRLFTIDDDEGRREHVKYSVLLKFHNQPIYLLISSEVNTNLEFTTKNTWWTHFYEQWDILPFDEIFNMFSEEEKLEVAFKLDLFF